MANLMKIMAGSKWPRVATVAALSLLLQSSPVLAAPTPERALTGFTDTFSGLPTDVAWSDGDLVAERWRVVFAGYGAVHANDEGGNRMLRLAPAAATTPSVTHAALVVSTATWTECVTFSTRLRTTEQLRKNSPPNPWEAGWLVWGYTDPEHFYYLAIKPNGWELGKRDPAYPGGQRFLATGALSTPIGVWRGVRVTQRLAVLDVYLDGAKVDSFKDNERPYRTGSVGFYVEDAVTDWDRFRATGC